MNDVEETGMRDKLINAILARTGVPLEQRVAARARYDDLSRSELEQMNSELAAMAAFGQKVRPMSPTPEA
jgi:hypothetical protein